MKEKWNIKPHCNYNLTGIVKIHKYHIFVFEGKTETYSEEYTLYSADISDNYGNAPESSLKRINFLDPIGIPELGEDQFVVFHLSPIWRVLDLDVALLGEVNKIVPVSNDRIVSIDFKEEQIAVQVQVGKGGHKWRHTDIFYE